MRLDSQRQIYAERRVILVCPLAHRFISILDRSHKSTLRDINPRSQSDPEAELHG
jgi:hypothetical protein